MDEKIIEETRREAKKLMDENRVQEALPLIRQLAHWGDTEAQKELIQVYWFGKFGMPKNPKAAFEYVRLSALNGDPESQYILADMFSKGEGTDKDAVKALYFMTKAAEAGESKAYDPLAVMYLMGWGTKRNIEQASYWNEKAAEADPENEDVWKHKKMIETWLKRAG